MHFSVNCLRSKNTLKLGKFCKVTAKPKVTRKKSWNLKSSKEYDAWILKRRSNFPNLSVLENRIRNNNFYPPAFWKARAWGFFHLLDPGLAPGVRHVDQQNELYENKEETSHQPTVHPNTIKGDRRGYKQRTYD